jgi:hypothetical protein
LETEEVAGWFTREFSNFKPLDILHPLQPQAGRASHIWIWPQDARANGMFVAAWQRES